MDFNHLPPTSFAGALGVLISVQRDLAFDFLGVPISERGARVIRYVFSVMDFNHLPPTNFAGALGVQLVRAHYCTIHRDLVFDFVGVLISVRWHTHQNHGTRT
jgi:hypothetical protein